MISTLFTALGIRKWMAYAALAVTVMALFAVAYLRIKASGAQDEKLKQLEESLLEHKVEADVRANVHSLSTADARKRLSERWGRTEELRRPTGA